jgi:prefoldin alpha subunit
MMEGTVEVYQQRSQVLSSAITSLRMAQSSLRDLEKVESNTPILVPVGGDAYVNAQLGDINKVIINLGANVSVEMNLEDALKDVEERLSEIEKSFEVVQDQLGQILNQMQQHQNIANRLSAELQGESVGV